MVAASIYIPKDNMEYPCGQDAHFIDVASQTIGVADGVGGWSKHGIDSGEYARQLITNSIIALHENHKAGRHVDPKRVIEEAYSHTTAPGSSTACIVALSGEDNMLRAANVGDSGFLVIRDGAVLYKSPAQQRSFNHPYQLGATSGCDGPSVAEEIEVRAEKGDVVVLGTDGLLDNAHATEISEIVCRGVMEWKDVMEFCCSVANVAHCNSFDTHRDTPYSIGARKAGYTSRIGGKVDDITVIIAMIEEQRFPVPVI
ncbi:probable protein phosphatase 2c 55 [Phtheirospermum japonicum]|uniref:Protein phosphatase n=1 Tax=Phtheirospermum japonicum TaxID=374723 RepID=A0A830B8T3_9LAMI|nr:probable protein phosphatase 2c 55 [Phtheirospermum japonicum]